MTDICEEHATSSLDVFIQVLNILWLLLLFAGKSKEGEVKRINKELANIRSKFKGSSVLMNKYFSLHTHTCRFSGHRSR